MPCSYPCQCVARNEFIGIPENLGDLATGHLRCEYDLHPPAGGHRIRIETDDQSITYMLRLTENLHIPANQHRHHIVRWV